jgi:outer membrane protein assembly factor BamB
MTRPRVYITSNQRLYALNARTVAKLWVYKSPVSDFLVYPAVSNGMLYVGDSSYYQFAFGLK